MPTDFDMEYQAAVPPWKRHLAGAAAAAANLDMKSKQKRWQWRLENKALRWNVLSCRVLVDS